MTTKINLRRAQKLRKELEASIKSPVVMHQYSLIQSNSAEEYAAAQEKLRQTISDTFQLSEILQSLRQELARSNLESGVEKILATMGHVSRKIALFTVVIANGAVTPEALSAGIEFSKKRLEAKEDAYSYGGTATHSVVSLLTPEDKAGFEEFLKKEKRYLGVLEDQRNALNVSTFIEISDESSAFLMDRGLL